MFATIVCLAVIIVAGGMVASGYNGLVTLRNAVRNAFAGIDVQLQRRYDLIPNLVEVAKKYMEHERETLEAVIAARNVACKASEKAVIDPANPESVKALVAAENSLGGVMERLFALSESYPDLKADSQMSRLMQELRETEDSVAYARQTYNNAVMKYNTKREVFPTNVIASVFNFQSSEMFKVETETARQAPKVSFQ